MQSKNVNVFFDVEGWEMAPQHRNSHPRLIASIGQVKEVLDRYGVKGVFNVCGIIAEYAPDIIGDLAREGHEIACHGYSHENFHYLNQTQLSDILRSANDCIRKSTGHSPAGIRCPWLTYDKEMLSAFKKAGYIWMSNQHMSHSELTFHSHRYRGKLVNMLAHLNDRRRWGKYPKEPYDLGGIVEIPLMSSTDGDIIGEVSPQQEIPADLLSFAISVLQRQFKKSRAYFNLNFHAIVIGRANRITILEDMLDYVLSSGGRFITAREVAESIALTFHSG